MFKIFQSSVRSQNQFQKIGLSNKEFKKINNLPSRQSSASSIFGKPVFFPDGYWFLYSLKEIFIDEVYKFNATGKAPIIIDCGANIGLSVIYFKNIFPNAKIIAFEPDDKIFEMFEKNIKSHNFMDVELIKKAVWTSNGELTFFQEGTLGGKINLVPLDEGKNIIKVQSVRLKDYLNNKIDFLKIDIEGAEFEVILDCKDELKNVGNLFFEYHGSKDKKQQILHEMLKAVTDAGFQYYIKESFPVVQLPFVENASEKYYDLMLNVFCYRVGKKSLLL